MNMPYTNLIAAFVVLVWALPCSAQNWDRFRGPNGEGLALDAQLPTEWSDDDYDWKVKLAGSGTSSPAVWGEKVFILSAGSDATLFLQCLNLESGKELWQKQMNSEEYQIHSQNRFASSSPAVDENHVYVTFASPEHTMLLAYDHQGNEVWKRDFGPWVSQHGFGASPMVHGDLVIFCNSQQVERLRRGQEPGKSEVIAVNRSSGEDVWRTPLTATRACYAMLCVYELDGQPAQLIGTNTGEGFYSIDPETGKMNWATEAFKMRTVASTFTAGGLIFGSNGSGGGGNYLVAAQPTEDGAEERFRIERNANYVPTPLAVGELLFLFGDRGVVSCLDLKTGAQHWRARVGSGYSGSPVANATHLYCMDQRGTVHVIEAASKYKKVSAIELGEASRATPAIVGDQILFRTESQLFSLSGKE